MLPNFLIIGAPKAATTWLADCLREHPEVFIPDVKELRFFCGTNYERGLAWYESYFENVHGENAVGEASPSYLGSYEAPQRIHEAMPGAKLILSLRHPIEQAYSFYWHQLTRGQISNDMSFELFFSKHRPRAGYYGYHLSRYLEYFKIENILILVHELNILNNADVSIKTCYEFLGVAPSFLPSRLDVKRNTARDVSRFNGPVQLLRQTVNTLPDNVKLPTKKFGKNILRLIPTRQSYTPLDKILRRSLAEKYYLSDIKLLEEIASIDLSCWYKD